MSLRACCLLALSVMAAACSSSEPKPSRERGGSAGSPWDKDLPVMSDYETKPRGGEGSGGSDAGSSPRREDLPGIADYDAARSAVSSGDLYGAISSLKRATAADDGCAEYWYNLGAAQSNLAMQLVADDESAAVQAFRDGVDSKKRAMELMKTGGFRFYTPEEQQQVRFDCEQALDGVDDVLADERSLVAALHLYAGR